MKLFRKTLIIETEGNIRGVTDADLETICEYLDKIVAEEMDKLQQFINLWRANSHIKIKITMI